MLSKEEARQKIAELVEKYQALTAAEIKGYHEAKTKQGFIIPLFRALGWDTDDTNEVAPEEKASKGRVDYAFKLHGVSQLYLEAKPLKADLNKPEYKEQIITYAYNKGVTWAVLTDFEGLRLFNAQTGKPFLTLTSQSYLQNFDKLWLLSHESLESGLLNKEAAQYGALPPAITIEKRLFGQLRKWREELSTQLHHYNPGLSLTEIDEVIQRFFNRLIFIRTCEDRGIEDRVLLSAVNQWKSGGHKGELIETIRGIFRQFDGYYDSDLFQLHPVDQVYIESSTMESVITGLYEVPGGLASYDFSVIDADVLGAVYEQYLGHVAGVAKERARQAQAKLDLGFLTEKIELEAKKQKRKEQGIYYTPKWVTDYIVKHTVGRFIAEHNYDDIRAIRVLDPACGSGSFLIRAYDELLQYHASVRGKQVAELDQFDRLPILTGSIFGVDLDKQAVEITCLNLLLRSLAKRDILPSLADNIRQGNSLISGGEAELRPYFGDSWQEKTPFNWEKEFPEIMGKGGFDVVIGNPPYVSFGLRGSEAMEEHLSLYLRDKFPNSAEYKLSTYALFIDRGLQMLRDGGYLGYILPDSFLLGRFFSKLRKRILESCAIREIVLFADDFWAGGTIGLPVILILQRVANEQSRQDNQVGVRLCADLDELQSGNFSKSFSYEQRFFDSVLYNRFRLFFDSPSKNLVDKMDKQSVKLGTVITFASGLIGKGGKNQIVSTKKLGQAWLPGLLSGSEINRYSLVYEGGYILYDTAKLKSGFKDANYFTPKIIMRQTGDSIIATYDQDNLLCLNNLHVGNLVNKDYDIRYVLAILNSKLINHYYHLISLELGRTMAQIDIETLEQLPMKPASSERQGEIVELVERMMEMHRRRAEVSEFEQERKRELEREIQRTDQRIDSLVYDLYGLTEEEIRIVEESGG